jgi:lipid II:glycine glycyltransferase (peptidoglycan interpeptide bridge formation enzyme)
MINIRKNKFLISRCVTWFASGEYIREKHSALITYFRQHTMKFPIAYVVQSEPFYTLIIDLLQNREVIHKNIAKNTRYEIERAEREGIVVNRYDELSKEFKHFLEQHAIFNNYKKLGQSLTQDQLTSHHLTLYKATLPDGTWLSYLLLTSDEERIRVWVFINNLELASRTLVGYASRRLIWASICDAQDSGLRLYDFGGVVIDERDPLYGVTRFKKSFGGNLVEERNSLVIPNPIIRTAYRMYCGFTKK